MKKKFKHKSKLKHNDGSYWYIKNRLIQGQHLNVEVNYQFSFPIKEIMNFKNNRLNGIHITIDLE